MDWLLDALVIVGVIAFIAQALIKVFSNDASSKRTSAWKWTYILSIIAGICFFIVSGLVSLWRFIQGEENADIVAGTAILLVGIALVWMSSNELFHLSANTKYLNYLQAIVGIALVMWMGFDLWQFYQENGHILSLENLTVALVGAYAAIMGIQRAKANNASKVNTSMPEQ